MDELVKMNSVSLQALIDRCLDEIIFNTENKDRAKEVAVAASKILKRRGYYNRRVQLIGA